MKANCRALKASIIISSIFLVLIIIFTLLVLDYDNKLFEGYIKNIEELKQIVHLCRLYEI